MSNSDLNNQAMKQLLKKYSSSELFVLPEAAHYLKVSEKYLTGLINQGKLKAFKVDSHWYIEEKYLIDFKKHIKSNLVDATNHHYLTNYKVRPWTKSLTKQKTKPEGIRWFDPLIWLTKSTMLAMASIGLVFFLFIPVTHNNNQKQIWASQFLVIVDDVYSWPLDLFIANSAQEMINDEALTVKINDMIRRYQPRGKVAGASERR